MKSSVLPTVGIVGGGQLALMMYQSAISLDLPVRFLCASQEDTVARLSAEVEYGSPHDADALARFAHQCDVLTFDHEVVNLQALSDMEVNGMAVRPSSRALRFASDKWFQRTTFSSRGLPTPAFAPAPDVPAVVAFAVEHAWPLVLKSHTGGYDGRGVWFVKNADETARVIDEAHKNGLHLYVEERVQITEEIAVVVVRDINGNTVTYPLMHLLQENGMTREVTVRANDASPYWSKAQAIALDIADAIDVCGVMAVEMFISGDQVLINEIATRPHNSAHFSIEGAVTSQFENHLRAVAGLPLGSTEITAPAVVMVNFIGGTTAFNEKDVYQAALVPGAHLHMYGKQWRPGRKLGHVTVCAASELEARDHAYAAASILEPKNS